MAALFRVARISLEVITVTLLIVLAIVVVLAVIFRFSGTSFVWYDEVASVMLAWITYYGAALAALKRKHIGFDSVLLAIPMPLRLWATALAEVLVLGFFVLLAWAGWEVLQVLEGESLVSLTWVPVQLTQSVIPVGATLFVVCELASLPGYWRAIAAGQSLEHAQVDAEIEEHRRA